MLRHYYINKEWMLSARARRVYRIAATLSLLLFLALVTRPFLPQPPRTMVPTLKLMVLLAVFGVATCYVAMEYFLFGFDTSPAWKKVFWFCVMLLPPVGPAIYCFAVYSRQTANYTLSVGSNQEPR